MIVIAALALTAYVLVLAFDWIGRKGEALAADDVRHLRNVLADDLAAEISENDK